MPHAGRGTVRAGQASPNQGILKMGSNLTARTRWIHGSSDLGFSLKFAIPNVYLSVQPESAVAGIPFVSGPLPAFTIGLGFLFALLYPLSSERHHEIIRQLELKREAALGAAE